MNKYYPEIFFRTACIWRLFRKYRDKALFGIISKERTGGGLNKRAVLLPPYSAHFRFFRIEQSRVRYGDSMSPASIG